VSDRTRRAKTFSATITIAKARRIPTMIRKAPMGSNVIRNENDGHTVTP
jgi:hypothetical protein